MNIDQLTVDDWTRVVPRRVQRLGRLITRRTGKWLFDYRAFNSEHVPLEGGFIIAPNHGSYFDGLFFAHGFQRTVRFMSKYQALEWPLIGRAIRWGGGFPVRRGQGDAGALDIARHILEAGHGLIMFMEGTLVRTPGLGVPRSGLAVLALQTGVPVVPVAAWGNKPAWVYGHKRRFWRRPCTTVVWGEPMRFERVQKPARELVEAVRAEIWDEVARLHDVANEIHHLPGKRPLRYEVPRRGKANLALPVVGPFAPTVHTGRDAGEA